MSNRLKIAEQIVRIGADLYAKDYISGLAGNISVRLPSGNILTTPAGFHKAHLQPEQMIQVDLEGQVVTASSGLRPTSELPMHLEVYRQRTDVQAVIHAHPITCVALSLVGIDLTVPLIPEALVMLGPVPTTQYATPSGPENREAIAGLIAKHDAIILAHHGTLTVGQNLQQAFDRLEVLEHTARTVALAYQLGTPRPLSRQAVEKLQILRQQIDIPSLVNQVTDLYQKLRKNQLP